MLAPLMTKNPLALVTGASRGLGEGFCRLLVREGYDLIMVSRDSAQLEAVRSDLVKTTPSARVRILQHDLAKTGAAQELYNQLRNESIVPDVLINNAGFGDLGPFLQSDFARMQAMMQLNMVTLTELTRLSTPDMVTRGSGRVLQVASVAAFLPGPFMATYYATKAYVLSLSVALSNELQGTGVSVSCLCPGPTKTHFAAAANVEQSQLFKANPMGLATAESVVLAGYRGMLAGKAVIIPGIRTSIGAYMSRIVPMSVSARIAAGLHKKS